MSSRNMLYVLQILSFFEQWQTQCLPARAALFRRCLSKEISRVVFATLVRFRPDVSGDEKTESRGFRLRALSPASACMRTLDTPPGNAVTVNTLAFGTRFLQYYGRLRNTQGVLWNLVISLPGAPALLLVFHLRVFTHSNTTRSPTHLVLALHSNISLHCSFRPSLKSNHRQQSKVRQQPRHDADATHPGDFFPVRPHSVRPLCLGPNIPQDGFDHELQLATNPIGVMVCHHICTSLFSSRRLALRPEQDDVIAAGTHLPVDSHGTHATSETCCCHAWSK